MNAQQTTEEDKHLDWVVRQYRGLELFWGRKWQHMRIWQKSLKQLACFDVRCWLYLDRGSEGLGCSLGLSSDRTARHFTVLTDFYFRLQLFGRLIRKSWTACRDCLMITTSDWTSSSKNPTSWRQLTKRIRRTTVTCWIGTDWWIICNLFLVARTCMVWCLKVLILCSHILHLRLEILSCHYSEVLERFLPFAGWPALGWMKPFPSHVNCWAKHSSYFPTVMDTWLIYDIWHPNVSTKSKDIFFCASACQSLHCCRFGQYLC